MLDDFEPVMAALFAHLVGAVALAFAADATATSAVLANVSSFSGLFPGLPVFGPGVTRGTVIQSIDENAATVTLSNDLTASGPGAAFKTGFLTTGRRVEHWNDVTAQPAMFLRRTGVSDEADQASEFVITTLDCEVWIYANAGKDPKATPDVMLANLEQLVRQSFAPDGEYGVPRFTLGGLVYWCRIEGKSDISPGDQGPQAIARIPVRITLP